MSRQNPGGEEHSNRTMKGCEKYQAQGKGDLTRKGYENTPSPMKHQTLTSPSKLEGASKGGHVRTYGHANTSMSGTIGPVGKQVGCK